VARKEEVGRWFEVQFTDGALEATVAAMDLLQVEEARWFSGIKPHTTFDRGLGLSDMKGEFPLVAA
jgi:hypothetical protein